MQTRRTNRFAKRPTFRSTLLGLFGLLLVGGLLLGNMITDRGIVQAQAPLQTYDLSWWTVDGGGGRSSGTGYALEGTSGQPDVGPSMSSERHTLDGGFWGGGLSGYSLYTIYLPLTLRNY